MTDKADPLRTYHQRMIDQQAQPVTLIGSDGQIGAVQVSGSSVAESSQTEDNATNDVLTFTNDITAIEIYHSEGTPQDFTVNGLTLTVAAGGWRSLVGGTPGKTVGLPTGVTGVIVTPLS